MSFSLNNLSLCRLILDAVYGGYKLAEGGQEWSPSEGMKLASQAADDIALQLSGDEGFKQMEEAARALLDYRPDPTVATSRAEEMRLAWEDDSRRKGLEAVYAKHTGPLQMLGLLSLLRQRQDQLRVVAAAHLVRLRPETTHGDERAVDVIVSAPPPARHHNLFAIHHGRGDDPYPPMRDQGFLLSDGSFATRDRAAEVAIAAGQVRAEKMTVPGQLYSEDLW